MIIRPNLTDYRLIISSTGKIIMGVSALFFIPLITALCFREWDVALDFTLGLNSCFLTGICLLLIGGRTSGKLRWLHSMVVVTFSWFIATMVCAIPHYLSGHFASYLDSVFDVMSGFTTTGLILIQDLDHVSNGLNMWRHLLTFVGGQGMIVLVLSFLAKGTAGAYMMYVGEGKEERLLPNVVNTTRVIWLISMVNLVAGSLVLWLVLSIEGMPWDRGFLHALWLMMSTWSTGGFAPQSQNILYYHSLLTEAVCLIVMVIGSLNFILHYTVWSGQRKEMFKNIEVKAFTASVLICFTMLLFALVPADVYSNIFSLFRRASFIIISGHTGTGLMNIYISQLLHDWGPLALLALTMAMAIGGSACSTCGGMKGLRTGIMVKGLYNEIKRLVLPEQAIFVTKFHHIRDIILTDYHVKIAGIIVLGYICLYLGGGLLGTYYGYPFVNSLFEATSAGSTTGLSCGITTPLMPIGLKAYYIFAMWAGRLEFIALFGMTAFIVSFFKK